MPQSRRAINGDKDDLSLPNDVFSRNHAHAPAIGAAVLGVVPVVPHEEIMPLGHREDLSVVMKARSPKVKGQERLSAWQAFQILGNLALFTRHFICVPIVFQSRAFDWSAIHIETPIADLNLIARQTNNTLDIICPAVCGQFEDNHIAALRHSLKDTSVKEINAKGKTLVAVTIRILGDKEIVTNQQRRLHAA